MASKQRKKRAEQIQSRFERDFLPRYGGLWKTMASQQKADSSFSREPKPATNFMDVIQNKVEMKFNIHNGDCGCCQAPVLDWQEERDQEYSSVSLIASPTTKNEKGRGDEAESSFSEQEGVSTPLPTDLEKAFGELRFGESLLADEGEEASSDETDDGDHEDDDISAEATNSDSDLSGYERDYKSTASSFNLVKPNTSETKKPSHRIEIDLVDSSDEEDKDEDFAPSKSVDLTSQNDIITILDSSSEEESSPVAPRRRLPGRQRAKNPAKYYIEDTSSSGNSSDALFDSPDEDASTNMVGRPSISKLIKTPTRNIDIENINPNRMGRKRMPPGTFKKKRDALSKQYFSEYDKAAFQGRLAEKVEVVWSNKLRTTAGLTRLKRRQEDFTPGVRPTRSAIIELSSKVLDDPDRLASTLLHEMVHAAAWIIDDVSKPPHGACFKKWAKTAMNFIPGSNVTTTHDYEIQYKYAWGCSNKNCNFVVQRHSRSVDTSRQCCGRCRGRLIEIELSDAKVGATNQQKTPKKRAPPSEYNLFVKEHSKKVRELLSSKTPQGMKVSQADVMKECGRLWRERKQSTAGAE